MPFMIRQRQGEIALAFLKLKFQREGVKIKPGMRREMANDAKEMNIPVDELMDFAEILFREIIEETFAKPVHSEKRQGESSKDS